MSAIYNTLQRLISAGRPKMADRVNDLRDQLTEDEYNALLQQLQEVQA